MEMSIVKKLVLGLLCVIACTAAANEPSYFSLISQAWDERGKSDFKNSALTYEKAFAVAKGSGGDYYNAACSWALAGNSNNAFRNLYMAIEHEWLYFGHLQNDQDLRGLHGDKRWSVLVVFLKRKIDDIERHLDQNLLAELKVIAEKDQRHRKTLPKLSAEKGWDSPEVKNLWEKQSVLDAENLIRVEAMIKTHGYPGKKLVGRYNDVAFLVIQHSNLKVQERYLSMLTKAADDKEINWSSVAMLVDRIHVGKQEEQIYGTQVNIDNTGKFLIPPIADRDNVDARRAAIGLPPLEQYINFMKQQLPH